MSLQQLLAYINDKRYRLACIALFATLGSPVSAASLSFDQLNWFGTNLETNNSAWGRVNISYTGFSDIAYFNLNVNGNWVVQNMGLSSLYGSGVTQETSILFDLGVTDGVNVSLLDYAYDISRDPLIYSPTSFTSSSVSDLDYQIGGDDNVDLGNPGPPPSPNGANLAKVVKEAKLPNIDKFINQVQKAMECAPAAISNSLKYLQETTTSALDKLDVSIAKIKPIVKWKPPIEGVQTGGTPSNWPSLKADSYKDYITTRILDKSDIDNLIDSVNGGHDVELDLTGHVAVIAGVRKFNDGRVELDIFDDNQKDSIADNVRTVSIINGKVNNKAIDGYVVESVPVPGPLPLMGIAAAFAYSRKIRSRIRFMRRN
jgi:hypothetical protein